MKFLNSKQLGKMLTQYSVNLTLGGVFDPDGVGDALGKHAKEDPDAPGLAKFLASIGDGKGPLICMHYWTYRDRIQEFQTANNISSVYWREITCRGDVIRFPEMEDQLVKLPRDIAHCAKFKDKTVGKFLEFCNRHSIQMYGHDDEYGIDTNQPINQQQVLALAKNYTTSVIGCIWEKQPVWQSDRDSLAYFIDEYCLFLHNYDLDGETTETEIISGYLQYELPSLVRQAVWY